MAKTATAWTPATMGRKGGQAKSEKKTLAARRNAAVSAWLRKHAKKHTA